MINSKYNTIIFDLGGVLIDWNPEYVFLKEFRGDRERMNRFLNEICAWDWNANQDAGYPIEKATEERIAMFPQHEELIRMYYGRWDEMLGYTHNDTLEILQAFVDHSDYRVLALTNWSAETFPKALNKFDWLKWFEGILVSGAEGMRKPFPEIYELLIDRYRVDRERAVFIDDSKANIKGAETVGLKGIHFTGANHLKQDLNKMGIRL